MKIIQFFIKVIILWFLSYQIFLTAANGDEISFDKDIAEIQVKLDSLDLKTEKIDNLLYRVSNWKLINTNNSDLNNLNLNIKFNTTLKPREYLVILQPSYNFINNTLMLAFRLIQDGKNTHFIPAYSKEFDIDFDENIFKQKIIIAKEQIRNKKIAIARIIISQGVDVWKNNSKLTEHFYSLYLDNNKNIDAFISMFKIKELDAEVNTKMGQEISNLPNKLEDELQDLYEFWQQADVDKIEENIVDIYQKIFNNNKHAIPIFKGEIADIHLLGFLEAKAILEELDNSHQINKIGNISILKPNINLELSANYNKIIQIPKNEIDQLIDSDDNSLMNLFCGILKIKNTNVINKINNLNECGKNSTTLCKIGPHNIKLLKIDNLALGENEDVMKYLKEDNTNELYKNLNNSENINNNIDNLISANKSYITQYIADFDGFLGFELPFLTSNGFHKDIPKIPFNFPKATKNYIDTLKNNQGISKIDGNIYNGIYVMRISVGKSINTNKYYLQYKAGEGKDANISNFQELKQDSNATDYKYNLQLKKDEQNWVRILAPLNYNNDVVINYAINKIGISKILSDSINSFFIKNLNNSFDTLLPKLLNVFKFIIMIMLIINVAIFGARMAFRAQGVNLYNFLVQVGKLIFVYLMFDNYGAIIKTIKYLSFYFIGNLLTLIQGQSSSFISSDANLSLDAFIFLDNIFNGLTSSIVLKKLLYLIILPILRPDLGLLYWLAMPVIGRCMMILIQENLQIIFQVVLGYLYIYILTILMPLFSIFIFIPITREVFMSVIYSIINFVLYPTLGIIFLFFIQTAILSLLNQILPNLDISKGFGSILLEYYQQTQPNSYLQKPLEWALYGLKPILNIINFSWSSEVPGYYTIILSTFILYCYTESLSKMMNTIRTSLLR